MASTKIETRLFINNEVRVFHSIEYIANNQKFMTSSCTESLTIRNPFDDSVVANDVQIAGETEINKAVAAAKVAYTIGPWRKFTGAQRSMCMLKFADLVDQNKEELARLETLSMGKPLSDLLNMDIPHMVGCYRCEYF